MKYFVFFLSVFLCSCGNGKEILESIGPKGETGAMGSTGAQGIQGEAGKDGLGCTVAQVEMGAIISCGDGSAAMILHGKPVEDCDKHDNGNHWGNKK